MRYQLYSLPFSVAARHNHHATFTSTTPADAAPISNGQDLFQCRFGVNPDEQAQRLKALQEQAAQSREVTDQVRQKAEETRQENRGIIGDVIETLTQGQDLLDGVKETPTKEG